MQNHPLTPMTDANLVRVMQAQCRKKVGLIDYATVAKGEAAIAVRIAALRKEGVAIAIVDAISDDDLRRLGPALRDLPLVTAGSGVAIGLPANWGLAPTPRAGQLPPATGYRAIVSGSCSEATRGQLEAFRASGGTALALDPAALAAGPSMVEETLARAALAMAQGPVLVYSTAAPEAVRAVQKRFGVEKAGTMVERALADVATGLVARGARQLVVAGGETSGAVVQALGVERLRIGPQIDPGVPWCAAHSPVASATVHLALKSGNFGAPDFFTKAFARLSGNAT